MSNFEAVVVGVSIFSKYVNQISISSFEGFSFRFFFFHGFDMWGFLSFQKGIHYFPCCFSVCIDLLVLLNKSDLVEEDGVNNMVSLF